MVVAVVLAVEVGGDSVAGFSALPQQRPDAHEGLTPNFSSHLDPA